MLREAEAGLLWRAAYIHGVAGRAQAIAAGLPARTITGGSAPVYGSAAARRLCT